MINMKETWDYGKGMELRANKFPHKHNYWILEEEHEHERHEVRDDIEAKNEDDNRVEVEMIRALRAER